MLLTACNTHSPVAPEPGRFQALTAVFSLTAEASGADGAGSTATCTLNWRFELSGEVSRTPGLVVYSGKHGGEAMRRVLQRDGSGVEFLIDVFGDVEAQLKTETGAVVIRIPVNENAGSQFYRQLARLDGSIAQDGTGSGAWSCAPLDVDRGGVPDRALTVPGTWQIRPITK